MDLYNKKTKQPIDYKFGDAKVTKRQRQRYEKQLPQNAAPIHETKPNKLEKQ